MQQMKQYIDKLKENKNVQNIVRFLWLALCTWVFTKMVLNLGYVSETRYQVPKDYFIGLSICYFLLAMALLQKVKLKNIFMYIFIAIYWIIAYSWLEANKMNWGEDLQNAYRMRWICGGIAGVLIIDMLRYKKIASLKMRNLIMTIVFVVVTVIVNIITKGTYYAYILLIPFMFFYLLRVDKKDWKPWIFSFSLGYYGAFLYTMIKSFMAVPYTGARYWGIYVNHGLFGIFIGGAFVCSLWWLIMAIQKKTPVWIKCIIIAAMLFSVICVMMNGARVAEFAVVAVGLVVLCIFGGKTDAKHILFRVAGVALAALICVIVFVIALAYLKNFDAESLGYYIKNDIIREKLLYWCDRAQTAFNSESIYGIFESGTVMNAIDRFSSSRLSCAVLYLRDLNLLGHESVYMVVGESSFSHPHNTFIYWLYGMGVLPGVLLIGWLGYYIGTSLKNSINKKEIYIFPFLWAVYFSVVSLNEDILLVYVTGFVLLLLQYPLLFKMEEKEEKN